MLNFKWLAVATLFLASIYNEPAATPNNKSIQNEPIYVLSCKPFPECEIENIESQI